MALFCFGDKGVEERRPSIIYSVKALKGVQPSSSVLEDDKSRCVRRYRCS